MYNKLQYISQGNTVEEQLKYSSSIETDANVQVLV
jgi:hypothetical protein